MGLDIRAGREAGRLPDDPRPQWSYTGFSHFCSKLATHIGIDLDQMQHYGGEGDWSTVESPLRHLLDHPDPGEPCDYYDTESSASRQHFIDTGHFLLPGEAIAFE